MSCRRSSRFWGLGCPKIFHEIEDSLDFHAKIFAQNLTAIFVRLAQWLADARYQHRRHGYRINFANALSR